MNDQVAYGDVYVAECAGGTIKVKCTSESKAEYLVKLGYKFTSLPTFNNDIFDDISGMYYEKKTLSLGEKADELAKLRDLGVPFAGGKEWNPQEVFEYLREEGFLQGSYLALNWKDRYTATAEEK